MPDNIIDNPARLPTIDESKRHRISAAAIAKPIEGPATVNMLSLGKRELRLASSNIKNQTLPVRVISDIFSADVIGGSNRGKVAPHLFTLIYEGRFTQTDVDGSKWIIRDRSASAEFFSVTGAKPGDVVVVDKLADYIFALRLKRGVRSMS